MVIEKGKLELTWVGKEDRPRLEPRVLIPDPSLSYHSHQPSRGAEIFDNRLISVRENTIVLTSE